MAQGAGREETGSQDVPLDLWHVQTPSMLWHRKIKRAEWVVHCGCALSTRKNALLHEPLHKKGCVDEKWRGRGLCKKKQPEKALVP